MKLNSAFVLAAFAIPAAAQAYGYGSHNSSQPKCQKTKVLILGAGVTGITAAQTLANNSINDFIIIDYNDQIGGRASHTNFGAKPDGSPYVVELGANWVQGLVSPPGPENPIWTLAKKYNLTNTYSNYSELLTYDENGPNDYTSLLDDFDEAFTAVQEDAGYILTQGLQDHSMRSAFSLAGWVPGSDPLKEAIEWWDWDFEVASKPEVCSELFGITGYNTTFNQYSDENNFVLDPRGFNAFIKGEASTFLNDNDPRLLLNTVVTSIDRSARDSVTVTTSNGSCITASHAIVTFSLGVLQNSIYNSSALVSFKPDLPTWKKSAILNFDMAIYTKIFLQFPPDKQFWPNETQFFLYADPTRRGYYPLFQSLSTPGFLDGSGILFVTVVADESRRVESQSDDETKEEVLEVLRNMFGKENVPEPTAFLYPRWAHTEWAWGSYSNWPTGVTLQEHQNLRANVGRVWFAGEHTSAEYFGFLHGGYFEGQNVANQISNCLKRNRRSGGCPGEVRYEKLRGNTDPGLFNAQNGWYVSSFQTWGLSDSSD